MQNVAEAAFEARKADLKGDGKAGRWFSPLELHGLPKLGKVPVEDIDQRDIETVLKPLWHTKAETAHEALNRLGIVLKRGAAMGYDVDLQVTLKAKGVKPPDIAKQLGLGRSTVYRVLKEQAS